MKVNTILFYFNFFLFFFTGIVFSLYNFYEFNVDNGKIGEGFVVYNLNESVFLFDFDKKEKVFLGKGLYDVYKDRFVVLSNKVLYFYEKGNLKKSYNVSFDNIKQIVLFGDKLYVVVNGESLVFELLDNLTYIKKIGDGGGIFNKFKDSVVYVEGYDSYILRDGKEVYFSKPILYYTDGYIVSEDGFLYVLDGFKVLDEIFGEFTIAENGWALGSKKAYSIKENKSYPVRGVSYFDYTFWKGFNVFASFSTLVFISDKPVVEKVFKNGNILDIEEYNGKLYVLTSKGLFEFYSLEGCYIPLDESVIGGAYVITPSFYPSEGEINYGEGWIKGKEFYLELLKPTVVECRSSSPKELGLWEKALFVPILERKGSITIIQTPKKVKENEKVRLYFVDNRTGFYLRNVLVNVSSQEKRVDEYSDFIFPSAGEYRIEIYKEGYEPIIYRLKVEGTPLWVYVGGLLLFLLVVGGAVYYYLVYVRVK